MLDANDIFSSLLVSTCKLSKFGTDLDNLHNKPLLIIEPIDTNMPSSSNHYALHNITK
jgi:hypothetical protein